MKMKQSIKNCLATTGLSLILLAAVATLYHARFLMVAAVFQTALVNVVIHAGLILLKRFESRYFLVEIVVEIGYVLSVVIIGGYFFDWYGSTPIWVLAVMGTIVYVTGCAIDIWQVKSDVNVINTQLRLRKRKEIR